jgi:UDP-2,3-diacylglucosamine pyrophosphatase LpxH
VTAVIVSDLHLGSVHTMCDKFLEFLDALPMGPILILNGDTIDRWHTNLPANHQRALERIREESRRRTVVWIRGNHDETYVMDDPAEIRFRTSYNFGKQLFVAHGHDFDNIMPYNRIFIWIFHALHQFRVALGAESVHVAHYAKKFPALYRVLCESVANNAIEHARENGYEAVVCGHTHHVDDYIKQGIRYLNTGAWTERPCRYVLVNDRELELRESSAPVASPRLSEHPTSNGEHRTSKS